MDVNEESKFLRKFKKKFGKGSGLGLVRGWGLGGEGRYERRSEVFVKIKKKSGWEVGSGGGGFGWGCQGGYERRIEVFEKILKNGEGGWVGGRSGGGPVGGPVGGSGRVCTKNCSF